MFAYNLNAYRFFPLLLSVVWSLAACLPGGPDNPDATPDDLPPGLRFAQSALDWSVPDSPGIDQGFATLAGSSWLTIDLEGDGKIELVWTHDPATGVVWGGTANPHWKVFRSSAQGFSTNSEDWNLPDSPGLSDGFNSLAGASWACMDINGDKRLDLLWTQDPNSGRVWGGSGNPHWKIYRGVSGGFGEEQDWSLPDSSALQDGFHAVAGASWACMDLDGDRKVDLVWCHDPASGNVWGGASNPHWKVFAHQYDGFALESSDWSLPDSPGLSTGFNQVAGAGWALVDLVGRPRVDLVWTEDPATHKIWGGSALAHWKVYSNDHDGFANDAVEFSVPDSVGISNSYNSVGGASWFLMDLRGLGRVQFVQSNNPTDGDVLGGTVSPHWNIYEALNTGFAQNAYAWSIPDSPGISSGFNAPAGAYWSIADVNDDQRLDLLWTGDTQGRVWGGRAQPHWQVFYNEHE